MTGQAGQPPGVVKIRVLGERQDIDALAAALAAFPSVELIDRSGPRPNRYDPGVRVYLTLRVAEPGSHGGPGPGHHGRGCGCPYCPPPGVTP